ncbi:UDP-galactopyranose mutase [bacterium 210820-DFI.6.52]|nr:UDP-galactopyranose mutase [bacterium 210820-DFI.6.52]
MNNIIVVGCGYAGAVIARLAAENGYSVTILEKRGQIAGNMFDFYDENGILVHKFGPHISVMNEEKVFNFLSRFTEWLPYVHHVNAEIDGIEVPLPFNLSGIDRLFSPEKAMIYKEALCDEYGFGKSVPILELLQCRNPLVQELAQFVFEKIFLHYTTKMWGLSPEEIDPAVTGRVPIRLSYDNQHFLHKYQVMPKDGFTALFEKMLDHPSICVKLNTDALDVLRLDEVEHTVWYNNERFEGKIIYTGALDALFSYEFGMLPYRSLKFEFNTFDVDYIQSTPVLNWPDSRNATRRTEMKRLTQQVRIGKTTTITEYPGAYELGSKEFGEPYYPIANEECLTIYAKYEDKLKQFPSILGVGRLADYKYYNMEATISRALDFFEKYLK